MSHDGDGVVATDDGIVFVPGALPGDRVRIHVDRRRAGVARGRLLDVLEPSPDRVDAACPLASRCGGCPLMGLSVDAQREAKRVRVEREVAVPAELAEPGCPLGYRRRARLAFDATTSRLGYRGRRSRTLVDVARCPVLDPSLEAALDALRRALLPSLAGRGEIALHRGEGGRAVVWVSVDGPQPPAAYRAAEALVGRAVAGAGLAVGGTAPAVFGDAREHLVAVDGAPLVGPPAGFSQANDDVSDALVRHAVALAEPDGARVLELYAGIGTFTVGLAPRAAALWAVEHSAPASEACRANLARRGITSAKVSTADAARPPATAGLDVVLLDPPRTGARDALEVVAERRPARVVYVSCDPQTLGRDVRFLAQRGYRPGPARVFDMFAHTAHVETVVRLDRTRKAH